MWLVCKHFLKFLLSPSVQRLETTGLQGIIHFQQFFVSATEWFILATLELAEKVSPTEILLK